MPAHISCNWLQKIRIQKKYYLSKPSYFMTLCRSWNDSYMKIRWSCEHSLCGTAAGTESCTGGNSADMWCDFPSSRCSVSPAPGGVSCGSWTWGSEGQTQTEKTNTSFLWSVDGNFKLPNCLKPDSNNSYGTECCGSFSNWEIKNSQILCVYRPTVNWQRYETQRCFWQLCSTWEWKWKTGD